VRTIRWLPLALVTALGAVAAQLPAAPAAAAPNTVRQAQWYLSALRIPQAQKLSTGAGVTVAVVDSPIDADVASLQGQELMGTVIGGTGDGTSSDASAFHGTGMAGVIAGKGANDAQQLGIAPGARILPVAVNNPDGNFDIRSCAKAIRWAVDHGAKVINLSIGHAGGALPEEVDAVDYALSKDVVVVASAGNVGSSGQAVTAPATIPGVIAVTGVEEGGDVWTGSAHGPAAVVAAPAVGIVQTAPKVRYASGWVLANGTSPAAAIVSGLAALIRARYPRLDAANVTNRIIRTAKDGGVPGRDPYYGFGTIDPLAALTADVPAVTSNPLIDPSPAVPARAVVRHSSPPVAWFATAASAAILIVVTAVLLLRRRRRSRRPGLAMLLPPGPAPLWDPPPARGTYPESRTLRPVEDRPSVMPLS